MTLQVINNEGLEKMKDDKNSFSFLNSTWKLSLKKIIFVVKQFEDMTRYNFLREINNEHLILMTIVFNTRVEIFARRTASCG